MPDRIQSSQPIDPTRDMVYASENANEELGFEGLFNPLPKLPFRRPCERIQNQPHLRDLSHKVTAFYRLVNGG